MQTLFELVVPNHGFKVIGTGNQVGFVAFEEVDTIHTVFVAVQGEEGLFFALQTPNLVKRVL